MLLVGGYDGHWWYCTHLIVFVLLAVKQVSIKQAKAKSICCALVLKGSEGFLAQSRATLRLIQSTGDYTQYVTHSHI